MGASANRPPGGHEADRTSAVRASLENQERPIEKPGCATDSASALRHHSTATTAATPPARPFAEIDEVSEDSPAAAAGLRVGDRVLKFGNVDAAVICAQGMAALAGLVNRSENLELEVVVQHAGEACPSSITLIPRRWQGRGM